MVGALLLRWTTLEEPQRPAGDPRVPFLPSTAAAGQELIDERLRKIPKATPAIRDAVVIQSAVGMTQILVELIATLRLGIDKLEKQIGQAASPAT